MLAFAAFIIGFIIGWFRAGQLGGDRPDRIQYGAAHGLALALFSLAGWVALGWLGWL